MRVGQRSGDLSGDGLGFVCIEGTLVQAAAKRMPLHQGHHVVEDTAGLARVDQRQNVRVIQPGDDLDLLQKPTRPNRPRQIGAEHLDSNETIVLHVSRLVHRGHPAVSEDTLDVVMLAEGGDQGLRNLRHRPQGIAIEGGDASRRSGGVPAVTGGGEPP